MITALLLNPCIDRTVFIDGFKYGKMNRITKAENIPAGKGANVAYALKKLCVESGLVMFGTKGEDPVKKRMEDFGIKCDKADVFSSIRVNTKLNNLKDNIVTEINEKGAQVTQDEIETIIKLSIKAAEKSDFFILTGSMPKGCDSGLYGEIIAKIKACAPECKLVLDAEGESFKKALSQKPYIIKPNKYEIEMHCKRKLNSIKEIAKEGVKLQMQGIEYVIISMGAQGAIICSSEGCIYGETPKVDVLNTVGAGDSMLASSIIAIKNNEDSETILKHAIAAGSAAVTCSNAELINKVTFDKLKDNIETKIIDVL